MQSRRKDLNYAQYFLAKKQLETTTKLSKAKFQVKVEILFIKIKLFFRSLYFYTTENWFVYATGIKHILYICIDEVVLPTYTFQPSERCVFFTLGLQHYKKRGRRGIEPNAGLNPFLKVELNVFCMHKTIFFLTFLFSLSNILHFGGYNMNKTRLRRP